MINIDQTSFFLQGQEYPSALWTDQFRGCDEHAGCCHRYCQHLVLHFATKAGAKSYETVSKPMVSSCFWSAQVTQHQENLPWQVTSTHVKLKPTPGWFAGWVRGWQLMATPQWRTMARHELDVTSHLGRTNSARLGRPDPAKLWPQVAICWPQPCHL